VGDALEDFDPQAIYDEAARDYEDACRDFWQYISIRTVERLGLRPGERVLDIPCGHGPSLVVAAEQVGPSGHVVGMDFAAQMVALARDRVTAGGLTNADATAGDLTALDQAGLEPFDAVVCSLGLFFVDDMPAVLRSLFTLVRPDGGRLGVAVFGEHVFDPLRQVFVEAVGDLAPGVDVLEPWRRTEDVDLFRQLFETAGIADVSIETDDDRVPLRSADDWWRIVMGSGFRRTVAALDESTADEVRRRCTTYIDQHGIDAIVNRSHYAVCRRNGS